MRSHPPALAPIFRSDHQARLLTELLLHPDEELSLSDLAHRLGIALSTVHLEVGRLVDAGVLSQRLIGRNRMLRADTGSRLVRPLTDLLLVTYGPATVIAEEFAEIDGARGVYIFGSWASRYAGEPGPPPNDLDVLVVGDTVSHLVVDAAARRAEERLRIPLNPVVVTTRRWREASDSLMAQVHASPIFTVTEAGNELAEPAAR